MHIELIGCTGAGKSTLLKGMLEACRAEGIEAFSGEEYVLREAGVSRLGPSIFRTLLIDLIAIPYALLKRGRQRGYMRLVSRSIASLPPTVPWLQKANLWRNVLKQMGMYELVRRGLRSEEVVIMDEGTVHTAHYLFVHVDASLPEDGLEEFARAAALPDAIIHVTEEERVLIERTLVRGHKRIPGGQPELVETFIQRALHTFDVLTRNPEIRSRLWTVSVGEASIRPGDGAAASSEPVLVKILQGALERVRAGHPTDSDTSNSEPTEMMLYGHRAD
ncbi:MAG: hypothetical protein ACM3QS_17330 [Bacteroidota bacterium]